MEERYPHITVVVGASPLAESVRRWLARRDIAHVGVTARLQGLRRSLLVSDVDAVTLCVALDPETITRYGDSLPQLLGDVRDWPVRVRTVGLIQQPDRFREVAPLGLDVYVGSFKQVAVLFRDGFVPATWSLTQSIRRRKTDWLHPTTARFSQPFSIPDDGDARRGQNF